jgi:prepilin-type N-terminal cleavage/methylation domain-containing protein
MSSKNSGLTVIELLVGVAIVGLGFSVYSLSKEAHKYLSSREIKVEKANILGDSRPEKFIQDNSEKWYSEVDSTHIESISSLTNLEAKVKATE